MSNCQGSCGCDSDAAAASPAGDRGNAGKPQFSSLFSVPRMDCPAEERLIRMALESPGSSHVLRFDLGKRELRVLHDGPVDPITAQLSELGLGARLVASGPAEEWMDEQHADTRSPADERRTLKLLLWINAVMFVIELGTGLLAESTGLIADSLDMFADAAVYSLALYAVGAAAYRQQKSARLAGWLQLALALGAIAEVLRRFIFGSEPEPPLMMLVASLALVANVACLFLLARHRHGGVHMRASWIFSTNDVLANLGVLTAGALVAWSGSHVPDLVVGALISLLVLNGARRILRLKA